MTQHQEGAPTRAETFAAFIAQAAREAGYNIDGQRGGGRKRIAEATGMGQTAVGRMLAGQSIPDPRYLEPLAGAVRADLRQVLIEAGVISERALAAAAARGADQGSLTASEAANRLGITIPRNVELFVTMVESMQSQESDPKERKKGVA